jgi:predicted MFS family arabinose efflux permease
LSIVEFLFLKSHLPAQDFAHWGWRLSFIFGGLIGVVSWLIRKHLRESPAFETLKSEGKLSHKPVHESLKEHRPAVIKAFWLSSLTLAGWYVSFAFTPIYLSQILKIDPSSQIYITAAMLALSTIFMPLFGYLADRSFRRSLLIFSSWAVLLLAYPLYYTIDQDPFALFVILEIAMTILLSIQFALLPTLLCDLFPIRIRYSGVGIGYNFCNVLFAGIAPLVALTLTHQPGFHMTPAYILMLAALLFLWSFLGLRKDLSHHEV